MTVIITILIIVLALMSISQRVLPWKFYDKFRKYLKLEGFFNLFAVSAFASLLIYNIPQVTLINVVAIVSAIAVALKTKNLPLTVLVAILISSFSLFL
ncbi:MAG: AzlD domain-containing protein [Thermoplasmataceae archaeon]